MALWPLLAVRLSKWLRGPIKGVIRPFKCLMRLLKSVIRPLRPLNGLIRPLIKWPHEALYLKGLIRFLNGLIRLFKVLVRPLKSPPRSCVLQPFCPLSTDVAMRNIDISLYSSCLDAWIFQTSFLGPCRSTEEYLGGSQVLSFAKNDIVWDSLCLQNSS